MRIGQTFRILVLFLFILQPSLGWSDKPKEDNPLESSTQEIYQSFERKFFGPFANLREALDFNYHKNYTKPRQLFQDEVISHFVNTGLTSDHPVIIFTAGAMAVGKTRTLVELDKTNKIHLADYVTIDMDQIRSLLPEYPNYIKFDRPSAGKKTQKEAGYIQELLTEASLRRSKNIIQDGSLRDWKWHTSVFQRIRRDFPSYSIQIYFVEASFEHILERARTRAIETGREVPTEVLRKSVEETKESVEVLKHLADRTYYYNNDGDSPVLVQDYQPFDAYTRTQKQTAMQTY